MSFDHIYNDIPITYNHIICAVYNPIYVYCKAHQLYILNLDFDRANHPLAQSHYYSYLFFLVHSKLVLTMMKYQRIIRVSPCLHISSRFYFSRSLTNLNAPPGMVYDSQSGRHVSLYHHTQFHDLYGLHTSCTPAIFQLMEETKIITSTSVKSWSNVSALSAAASTSLKYTSEIDASSEPASFKQQLVIISFVDL